MIDSKSANILRFKNIKINEEDMIDEDEGFKVFKRLASLYNNINYDEQIMCWVMK